MKVLKFLAVVSVLATSAFAQQDPGLFVTLGGGYAKLSVDDLSLQTNYGETLGTRDGDDTVGFLRAEIGYRFDSRWDLSLGYADYGQAELHMAFPKYPGIASILPLPEYSRNVMQYEVSRLTLIPSYTHSFGDKLSLRARVGITYDQTKSHFETTYYAYLSGPPSGTFSKTFPEVKKSTWSYLLSLGAEYAITAQLSVGVTIAYAPLDLKPASEEIFGVANGVARPDREKVDVSAVEGAVVFTWRQ